jgi:hypothetical protein
VLLEFRDRKIAFENSSVFHMDYIFPVLFPFLSQNIKFEFRAAAYPIVEIENEVSSSPFCIFGDYIWRQRDRQRD